MPGEERHSIEDLARRAVDAWQAREPLVVSPQEYIDLRSEWPDSAGEYPRWDTAVLREVERRGMPAPAMQHVSVIVRRSGHPGREGQS